MGEAEIQDLQAVSGQVMADAERITRLETEKRRVEPGTAHFADLSRQIQGVAEHVADVATAERDLADEVAGDDLPTIEQADRAAS